MSKTKRTSFVSFVVVVIISSLLSIIFTKVPFYISIMAGGAILSSFLYGYSLGNKNNGEDDEAIS